MIWTAKRKLTQIEDAENRSDDQCWERSRLKWFQIKITHPKCDLKSKLKITCLKSIYNESQNHCRKKTLRNENHHDRCFKVTEPTILHAYS